jgi:RimJ/RimL family protein N-acetyltransferase
VPGPTFLRGDVVDLNTFEEEDLGLISPVFEDREARQRMGSHLPYTERGEREWFEGLDGTNLGLTVCPHGPDDESEPEAVGVAMLFDVDAEAGTAELGATLVPEHTGKGYGRAAAGLLLDYAFSERRLHRVRAMTLSVNDPARAVLESLGFTHEGTAREAALYCGERVDELHYGLLAPEWTALEPPDG